MLLARCRAEQAACPAVDTQQSHFLPKLIKIGIFKAENSAWNWNSWARREERNLQKFAVFKSFPWPSLFFFYSHVHGRYAGCNIVWLICYCICKAVLKWIPPYRWTCLGASVRENEIEREWQYFLFVETEKFRASQLHEQLWHCSAFPLPSQPHQ